MNLNFNELVEVARKNYEIVQQHGICSVCNQTRPEVQLCSMALFNQVPGEISDISKECCTYTLLKQYLGVTFIILPTPEEYFQWRSGKEERL